MPGARLVDARGNSYDAGDSAAGDLAALFAAAGRGDEFCLTPNGLEILAPASLGTLPSFQCETSGTSGTPKRIRRTQASWLASIVIDRARFGIGPGSSVGVLGGLESSLALYGAVEALCLGADLHVVGGMRPDRQLARLDAQRVSLLWATPTQVRQLAACGRPCASLRHLLVGGGRFDRATREMASQLFPGAEITEFYGSAETSFITLTSKDTPDGSVGRAYAGVVLEIRGADGQVQAADSPGEIWVRSPYLFTGYARGGSDHTKRDGPWLTIGETGALDESGHLRIGARAGRMVTVSDRNVSLDAVEEVLLGLDGVAQAGVVAMPDPLRGQILAGVLQCSGCADPEVILRQARAALGATVAPRRLVTIDHWPQLASGKTDYAALRARLDGDGK
ncbi:AMP-binding protein [Amaricoccus macauensis]|uniref:AMP-binding protein n=1 Tax=Amaricoccus macauensis TaxID=57001 RepID=UPI003C7BCB1B